MLAITESSVPLTPLALGTLLKARMKREKIEAYHRQMLYLGVKLKYKQLTSPDEYAKELMEIKRKPKPKEEIISDIIAKLS